MNNRKTVIREHMMQLSQRIGFCHTVSEANKGVAEYAARVFEDFGLAVRMQEFACMEWQNEGTVLLIDGQSVKAEADEYWLPCSMQGPMVFVKTVNELKQATLEGKICVISGELCKATSVLPNFSFSNTGKVQKIIRQLEEKNPLAVLAISNANDGAVPIFQDEDFDIPCAVVKREDADKVLVGKEALLSLNTEQKLSKRANLIAVHGAGSQKISISVHIHEDLTISGLLQNISSVSALLTLAARVIRTKYPYQIEFVIFSGEDYDATLGEKVYRNLSLKNPDEIVCAFNIEGAGMPDSKISYSLYECEKAMEQHIIDIAEEFANIVKIDPWPREEHMIFASDGVPTVAVTLSKQLLLGETGVCTLLDGLECVDLDMIAEAVEFLNRCV